MYIPFTNSNPVVPRRVVVFGILLSVSLALLGIFGSHLVAELSASYQEIVARQIPSMGIMRNISQTNANGRRLFDSLSIDSSPEEIARIQNVLADMRDSNSLRLVKLDELLSDDKGRGLTESLKYTRKRYRQCVDDFFVKLKKGMSVEDRKEWNRQLAAMDSEYVLAQDKLVDYCSRSAGEVSEVLTVRSQRLVIYFLLVAAWPIVLVSAFFAFGFLSTLVLFIKGKNE